MRKFTLIIVTLAVNCSIAFSQGCLPEGITFTTQEEIDNFQTEYPGCTEIEGDVVINGDDISNLNGLNVLTSFGKNLHIQYNWNLSDLIGLDNLSSIGGSLIITNNVISSLTGLEQLETIGGNLQIEENHHLKTLESLNNIDATSIQDLSIFKNDSLTVCGSEGICDYLSNPNGVVDIYLNGVGCNTPGEIANGCGFTMPCLPQGNYYFKSQDDIDNFQSHYQNCTEINGNVRIDALYYNITNLLGLNTITSITGNLSIFCDSLYSLDGLNNITSIGGNVRIGWSDDCGSTKNNLMANLTGMENLESVGGDVVISGNGALSDLTGLDNLKQIDGDFVIFSNDTFTSLTGLNNLDSIGGNMKIGDLRQCFMGSVALGNKSLLNITDLDSLTYVGGSLWIMGNTNLQSVLGLENLNFIGSDIWILENDSLETLAGLENITTLGGSLRTGIVSVYGDQGNLSLVNLSGLENLTSLGGGINLINNYALKDIEALSNITSIGDNITIHGNNMLTNLNGLNNIDAGSIEILYIAHNDSLSFCQVQSICNYLAVPDSTTIIWDNAPGCNSTEEVDSLCNITGVPNFYNEHKTSIYPNPVNSTLILIGEFALSETVNICIYNTSGICLKSWEFTNQKTGQQEFTLDLSNLLPGIYFLRLQAGNEVVTKKVVKL